MPHNLASDRDGFCQRAQVIGVRRTDDGIVFVGGSDFRKDGQAAGW